MPFSAKITKMPLVNPGLTKGQTRSKSLQNNIFHGFISNLNSLEIFGNFDQVQLDLRLFENGGPTKSFASKSVLGL